MSVTSIARRIGREDFRTKSPTIEGIFSVLGINAAILPLWDGTVAVTGTSFTSKGRVALSHTFASAPSGWGTAPSFQGIAPILTMAASTAEEAEGAADDAFWTPISGGVDVAFSVGAWVNVTDSAAFRVILSKWDDGASNEREWLFGISATDALELHLADQSAGVTCKRASDAAITQGSWVFLVATYDGGAGATAANGIKLYQNAALLASTATNNAAYVNMEDLTQVLGVGVRRAAGVLTEPFNGSMAGGIAGPFLAKKELSAEDVRVLYEMGKKLLNL